MEIKVAEYKDYERIAHLHAQSWKTYYQGILGADYLENEVIDDRLVIWQTRLINPPFNQHVLIAEDDGQLCGFICAFGNHDYEKGTIIDALHVDSRYRGQGVGAALFIEMAKWIEQYFADTGVYLEVMAKNNQAIDFYEHLGGEHSLERLWDAPCGNQVPELVYTWPSASALLKILSDSSISTAEID
ncbi:GNAT family N-acetyltransferase [Vibrio renipiscarius]|uniref:Histone acetyltransferase n=1 Tax=Vibrio renipiscarius TaxID=1461322 RepID=A0A0C2NY11_9VIBR|nr:GNAT family N-acetyltransferase [Vibrio renipiscarius]KII75963.1 histone acetyltransferase [Vibrio renipiscarius]KII79067.1 histone acetyltransferase [Vibrio renipiscarius]